MSYKIYLKFKGLLSQAKRSFLDEKGTGKEKPLVEDLMILQKRLIELINEIDGFYNK